ncbi:enoyl-CoA hydratase/isomerase family protein [Muricoccus pecuniae]|uniref:Enoyl-CoA hydratase/carnithine racemase n=1 Tax=Muricoccus pecuniae TaxID=693023 RepID=A0A840Y4M9_9PROT|nr:enoyl-CoA hydratase/isomerase family protein [Roseomonas pecuniae]MBB5695685.1 enoyl-CoA hydratase/carnithine racemase [Roseomonas pecuniae]
MNHPDLHLERDGGIATLTIARPARRNALTLAMWQALAGLFDSLSAEGDLRCVVLRGAGEDAFSAGADVTAFAGERGTEERERAYNDALVAAFLSIERCAHPVVAAVRGHALGGGCGLALMCDFRVGGPSTRMGIPARMLNLYYPHEGLDALLRIAGHAVAMEMLVEGRTLTGEEALARGLLTRLVPDGEVGAEALALAGRIAQGAPLANRFHKRALRALRGPLPLTEADRAELDEFPRTADFQEGVAAFNAKRRPVFQGR